MVFHQRGHLAFEPARGPLLEFEQSAMRILGLDEDAMCPCGHSASLHRPKTIGPATLARLLDCKVLACDCLGPRPPQKTRPPEWWDAVLPAGGVD